VPGSFSSGGTAASLQSEAVLRLGRRLVEELGLAESTDTLARWMAHHIAELIEDVEKADGVYKAEKTVKCRQAIVDLWQHRHELPDGKRPFEDLEPVLRALSSLDPDGGTHRYFRASSRPHGEEDERSDTERWLELAEGLDASARILICYCLGQAAVGASEEMKEWLLLAEAAALGHETEFPIIRIIVGEGDLVTEPDPNEQERKELEERIQRLEGFRDMAQSVADTLRRRVNDFEGSKGVAPASSSS
jgi:hypothetical protein